MKFDRAGEAVDEAEAEEEKRGRHAAEEKIFQRGFGGFGAGFVETGEDVERKAGELESEEGDEELLRGGHQREARGGKEHDGDELGGVAEARGAAGEGQREPREHEDAEARGEGELVEHEHPAEGGIGEADGERAVHRGDDGEAADDDGGVEPAFAGLTGAENQIEGEGEQGADDEGRFGQQGVEEFGVVHSEPPFSAACMRGDCRAGVIQSRRTSGLRPT